MSGHFIRPVQGGGLQVVCPKTGAIKAVYDTDERDAAEARCKEEDGASPSDGTKESELPQWKA